jgi:protein tyrosine/serine phosphatase
VGAHRRSLHAYVIAAAFIAFSTAMGAATETGVNGQLSNIGIDNFGRINANYYRGAQPVGRDYTDLAALGVKTVIDLTSDGEAREPDMVKSAGMKFYRIPMTTHVPPTAGQVEQFLKLVSDPANQPVFVHCQGGRHRTGVMTAVYRMTTNGWAADQAFAEMKRYSFGADFLHSEFKSFVYAFRPASMLAASSGTSETLVASDVVR